MLNNTLIRADDAKAKVTEILIKRDEDALSKIATKINEAIEDGKSSITIHDALPEGVAIKLNEYKYRVTINGGKRTMQREAYSCIIAW